MKYQYKKNTHKEPIYISGICTNEYWQQFQYRK
jgi:hypothetical protein